MTCEHLNVRVQLNELNNFSRSERDEVCWFTIGLIEQKMK